MAFRAFVIEGFRAFSSLKVNGFKQINLFVGKNNSGKTSLLESIFVMSAPTNPLVALWVNGYIETAQLGYIHSMALQLILHV